MALSDTTVRQARITGNDYTIGDTDGLALNVTARGGKTWRFRYYWAGVQKRMSLDSYPQISLKEARARRDEARALVAQGINLLTPMPNCPTCRRKTDPSSNRNKSSTGIGSRGIRLGQ
jgi:hypothetical protein